MKTEKSWARRLWAAVIVQAASDALTSVATGVSGAPSPSERAAARAFLTSPKDLAGPAIAAGLIPGAVVRVAKIWESRGWRAAEQEQHASSELSV